LILNVLALSTESVGISKIKGILTVDALKHLMEQIEEKDRTRIKAKDQILKE